VLASFYQIALISIGIGQNFPVLALPANNRYSPRPPIAVKST
jgi:hypothetical protein